MGYEPQAVGIRLNNPGHIEKGDPWQGLAEEQKHSRFATFESPVWGLRAIARTLITYNDKYGIRTVQELTNRWAPPWDNNPTSEYAKFLANKLKLGINEAYDVYDPETLRALLEGIVRFETGKQPYTKEQYDRALELAGVPVPLPKVTQDKTVATATAVAVTSTVGVAVQSSDSILEALQQFTPYSDKAGLVVATATLVLAGLAIYVRIKERKGRDR